MCIRDSLQAERFEDGFGRHEPEIDEHVTEAMPRLALPRDRGIELRFREETALVQQRSERLGPVVGARRLAVSGRRGTWTGARSGFDRKAGSAKTRSV